MLACALLLALPLLAQLAGANPGPDPAAEPVAVELEARNKFNWVNYGCHYDCYDGMNRYLPTFVYARDDNSPDKCIQACRKQGFKVAGLQFGKECWCGQAVAGQLTDTKDCWVKCKNGASKTSCGGPCRNMIWGVPGLSNS